MNTLHLALLEADETQRALLCQQLTRQGLTVAACADAQCLYFTLDHHFASPVGRGGTPIVVYLRSVQSRALVESLVPHLRQTYAAPILIQCDDAGMRVRALDCGADLCVDDRSDPIELAALMRAQVRRKAVCALPHYASPSSSPSALRQAEVRPAPVRHPSEARPANAPPHAMRSVYDDAVSESVQANRCNESAARYDVDTVPAALHPHESPGAAHGVAFGAPSAGLPAWQAGSHDPGHAYGVWTLSYQDWVLINPRGVHISLTGIERQFFSALMQSDRRELSRKELDRAVGGSTFKSISVVVSRMRKKVGQSGSALPLHTVHGMGYVFIGTLVRNAAA